MKISTTADTKPEEIGSDLLCGADDIAAFLFGPGGSRRKVYYLAACTRIPVFRLGAKLCARRSVLLDWISRQENRALALCASPIARAGEPETA
jgi:hypothetical protein